MDSLMGSAKTHPKFSHNTNIITMMILSLNTPQHQRSPDKIHSSRNAQQVAGTKQEHKLDHQQQKGVGFTIKRLNSDTVPPPVTTDVTLVAK